MLWLNVLISSVVCVLLLWVLPPVATRLDLVDRPGGRKAHDGVIPLIGGLAMFLAFVFALLTLQAPLSSLRALVAGASLLVVVGVLDDMHELSARVRFVVQILAGVLMIYWGGVELHDLGALVGTGTIVLGVWTLPLTVFAVVGVINALNMIDGVDGLAGSVSFVTVMGMVYLALAGGADLAAQVLLLLAAAIVGFLLFNLRLPWQHRARVFMGDAGSMFLGFVLAWFLVQLSQGEKAAFSPAVALWLFGLPLIDTVTMMLRRISKGRSPFAADREHFHHVLLLAGFTPSATLGIMVGAAAFMAMIGIIGQLAGVPEWVLFYGFLLVFVAYFYLILHSWKVMRFLRRSINRRHSPGDRRCGLDRRHNADPDYRGVERRSGVERRVNTEDRRGNR